MKGDQPRGGGRAAAPTHGRVAVAFVGAPAAGTVAEWGKTAGQESSREQRTAEGRQEGRTRARGERWRESGRAVRAEDARAAWKPPKHPPARPPTESDGGQVYSSSPRRLRGPPGPAGRRGPGAAGSRGKRTIGSRGSASAQERSRTRSGVPPCAATVRGPSQPNTHKASGTLVPSGSTATCTTEWSWDAPTRGPSMCASCEQAVAGPGLPGVAFHRQPAFNTWTDG